MARILSSRRLITALIAVLVLVILPTGLAFHWLVNRVYVPQGSSLRLKYKGPLIFGSRKMAASGHLAEDGEIGILGEMRGPGRHFYCPIWWERTVVPDVVIKPGYVGIVTSKMGDALPEGEFLVDGELGATEHRGVLRTVLAPGTYRINDMAYDVEKIATQQIQSGSDSKLGGWVDIPTGYVGVVTNLTERAADRQRIGIQKNVLPPGIYAINPNEKQIDIVEIGFREKTVAVTKLRDGSGELVVDEAGEPQIADLSEGISFPSKDGFPIHMDFTAIWGLMPDQASSAISEFGNIEAVENKVVTPQIESICRNEGSQYSAVQLLVGEDRTKFQDTTKENFEKKLNDKNITLLYGLVRHIYIPREVRQPIQSAFIANELTLTRDQEQLTAQEEAKLRETERKVDLESEKIRSDTEKQVAEIAALGEKTVGETEAETTKLVAAIDRQVAELEAQATIVLGEARANAEKMKREALSQKFQLAVEAFGSPAAYNNWIFATGLPDDVDLKLLYAGEGTLWTDMKDLGLRATVPVNRGK
ncbi:MAG: SPFH domain-containing protein [Pirellulales bacterium]|nr:SPFH domain-containing protein [Pirellulales bacterium]